MKHLAIVLVTAVACSSPPRPPPTEIAPPPPAVPIDAAAPPALSAPPVGLRLPSSASPRSYRLALDVDPAKPDFTGHVAIELELREAVHPLWLDAKELTIDAATVRTSATAAAQPLRVVPGTGDVIGLAAAAPIGPGVVTVEIDYRGHTDPRELGVDRVEDRGDWYLVTDLETDGARRVTPCFDEPGWKVPWQLELTMPAGLFATANSPIDGDEVLPDGRRRVRFAPTAPIPSYLFAFAVGPFEAVDAGTTRGGVPMRIIVPRGRAADAAFMARQSGLLVAALEDYTGIPFPYAKLDHLAVPGQNGGAMENVGLITYAPWLLLIPDTESDDVRFGAVGTMAHELAHQWFGDLVTLAWWDDTWLNEGFATWAANRLLAEHYRALGGDRSTSLSRWTALEAEADPNARAIRQPVVEQADVSRSFDGITYEKGATVLDMFERSLGSDVFRAGVRAYLAAHRDGNATAADFIGALAEASHQDLAASLATWLDRPGAPVVGMTRACPRGGPATLELTQHRYRVAGDTAAPDPTIWNVPVCVRVPGEAAPRCTTLTDATGRIELGPRCPRLVVPTGRGHYRAAPDPALRAELLAAWARLEPTEQIAFASDTAALVAAGEVPLPALLDLMPRLGRAGEPVVVQVGLSTILNLADEVADADRPAFQALVRRWFGKLAHRTGWMNRPGEPMVQSSTRDTVVPVVASIGHDPILARQTLELAGRWLDDHTVVPVTRWAALLRTAGRLDDAALFERMLAAFATEPSTDARRALARGLGVTPDPARLQRALEQLVGGTTIDPVASYVLFGPDRPATTAVRMAFWGARGAEMIPKLPEGWRTATAPDTCLAELRDEAAAILDAYFVALPDYGKASRDRALATMDTCIRQRAARAEPLAAYLAAHR